MIEKIYILVAQHLILLEKVILLSNNILKHTKLEDINSIVKESENRDRLVNIIAKLQGDIERVVEQLAPHIVTKELISVLKYWNIDLNTLCKKVNLIDQEIIEQLSEQKESLTKEIATIFQAKEQFKGYNLSSVK